MRKVYINSLHSFLPNSPVTNEDIESYLGLVDGKESRVKRVVLFKNGIKKRYYALNSNGEVTHTNSDMTVRAIRGLCKDKIEMLCCATSTPDQLLPSHASMVHGQLKCKELEIYSFSGVCLTSIQALKVLYNSIRVGNNENGVCTASELISPTFLSENYTITKEHCREVGETDFMEFEREFLRFMLSDGAAALYLDSKPNVNGLSLRIDWIEMKSYANHTSTCMFMGGALKEDGELKGWKEFSAQDRVNMSVFSLNQDFKILLSGMKFWVDFIEECMDKHGIDFGNIDYVIPHISSKFIGEELRKELIARNVRVSDNWFINLCEVGNIGSASIFIALNGLLEEGTVCRGNRILLLVPESGRFSYGTVLLSVV